jgi:predicted nucleic acid-binding protein
VILVDTSVWIDIFRDTTGGKRRVLLEALQGDEVVLSRFCQLELLQGCRDEKEWSLLRSYLSTQEYIEASTATWESAARIYFELRRSGLTVRSPIDCCIAQLALENDLLLLHRDRDFNTIVKARPLRQLWIDWS